MNATGKKSSKNEVYIKGLVYLYLSVIANKMFLNYFLL